MCNDYEQHAAWAEDCRMMQLLELSVPTQQSETDLPRADDVPINDAAAVMCVAGNDPSQAPARLLDGTVLRLGKWRLGVGRH
jgi:hypothetical protein